MATDLFDPAKIDVAVGEAFGTKPTRPAAPTTPAPLRTNNPGALMPKGQMAQYGTMDEGLRALDQNLQAYGKKGINTLEGVINTWSPPTGKGNTPEGTRNYINHVARVTGLKPDQPIDLSDPLVRLQLTAGITQFESGPQAIYGRGPAAPSTPAAPRPASTPGQLSVDDLMKPEAVNAAVAEAMNEPPKKSAVGDKVRSFLRGSAALADTLLGVVPAVAGMATYAGARATGQTPEQAAATRASVTGAIERPVGRAFGVTETPEYKGEFSQRVAETIGKFVGETAESISKKTGIPKPEVEYYLEFGASALPFSRTVQREVGMAGRAAGQAAGRVVEGVSQVTPAPVRNVVRATVETALPGTTRAPARPAGQLGAAGVLTEAPGAELRRNAPNLEQQYQADRQAAAQGQAAVEPQPGVGTARPTAPDAPFTEIKYAETGLPLPEQHARAQTLRRVLGEDYQADLAAIEGKGKERATNYTVSNTDTPQGNFLKDRFADEQRRLAQYADQRIRDTGGTIGLDESAVYKRGNTILKPLQDLQTYFDDATRKIYADRDAIAAQVPVEANNISRVLGDESLWKANTETIGLRDISLARMKQLGMIDKDGNLLPTNAKTAESFRQFLTFKSDVYLCLCCKSCVKDLYSFKIIDYNLRGFVCCCKVVCTFVKSLQSFVKLCRMCCVVCSCVKFSKFLKELFRVL